MTAQDFLLYFSWASLFSFSVPALCFFYADYFKGGVKLDLISFVIYFNLIFLIGFSLLLFNFSDVSNSYFDPYPVEKVMGFSLLAFFYFVVFFCYASKFFCHYFLVKLDIDDNFFDLSKIYDVLVVLSWLSFGFLIFHIVFGQNVAIKNFFSMNSTSLELATSRAETTQASGFLGVLVKELLKNYIPLLFPLLLMIRRLGFRSKFLMTNLIIAFFASLIATAWFIEKASVVYFGFSILAVHLCFDLNVSFGRILSYLSLLFFFLVGMFYFFYLNAVERDGVGYLIQILSHRFTTQVAGYVLALYVFPDYIDFRGISGISGFFASVAGDKFQSTYGILIDFLDPENAAISGAMSSFAVGDAWGLFGIWGVLISPFVCGVYYGLANLPFKGRARVILMPLVIFLFSKPLLASGFYGFLYPIGMLSILLPYWLFLRMFAWRAVCRK